MKLGVRITLSTYRPVPNVIPGQHGEQAQYVLMEARHDAHPVYGYDGLAGIATVNHTLEFEIMPGSETERKIYEALGLGEP